MVGLSNEILRHLGGVWPRNPTGWRRAQGIKVRARAAGHKAQTTEDKRLAGHPIIKKTKNSKKTLRNTTRSKEADQGT